MSDRNQPEFLDPQFEPGEFDRVERHLRRSLTREADQITPRDRLGTILHEAHEAGPASGPGTHTRHWLMPLAAAAAVALVAGGAWAVTHGSDDQITPTPPASSGPVATTGASSPSDTRSATTTPSTQPSTSATATGVLRPTSLPVYFVGPVGDSAPTYKLYREFIATPLPAGASDSERAKGALVRAINAQPFSNTDGYLQPWSGQTIGRVDVTGALIRVDLANAGNPDAAQTAEIRRLAVQELVWTAQAAIGKGNIPVRFTVQGASAKLFGSIATDQPFTRPPSDQLYQDLAPIWITAPARDQVLPAGKAVTVQGLAIVFEANVSWELQRGTTQVKNGHTSASAGAPVQGKYTIGLGVLPAGDYSIRVWEASAKDGSVAAEKTVSFSVR